jgi:DNA-binding transcriptional LysR family regulator
MTLGQLRSFATVARLGSVKAAARALGVSEPAVSGAVSALRRDLGDELFVRAGGGLVLTPGGQRLAGAAAEILGIADQARRAVREARGETALLRVAGTSTVLEHVAAPLFDAFTRRTPNLEVSAEVEPATGFAELLGDRRADVTLGPRPPGGAAAIASVPFLRYRLVVVGAPGRRADRWLVGPSGQRLGRGELRAFPSEAAALVAAEAGEGVLLALERSVRASLGRGSLVRLDAQPVEGIWHASALAPERRDAAWALMRFVTTPEAIHAMHSGGAGVPAGRFRPTTYVTLWS